MFEVQKGIVRNIVGRLLSEVKATEMVTAYRARTSHLRAYELVKLGNYYTQLGLATGGYERQHWTLLGKDAYEQAIELDPEYPDAYVWLCGGLGGVYRKPSFWRL